MKEKRIPTPPALSFARTMSTRASKTQERSVSEVEDRAGRRWTITVTDIDENEALDPWRSMTGDERVALIGECVLDGLRLKGQLDIPRLRRVHRVLERAPRPIPDRGRVRGGVPRATSGNEGHRRSTR